MKKWFILYLKCKEFSFGVSDLDNTDIEIPAKNDPKFPTKIGETELKDFLLKYSGKTIRVLSKSHAKPKLLTF